MYIHAYIYVHPYTCPLSTYPDPFDMIFTLQLSGSGAEREMKSQGPNRPGVSTITTITYIHLPPSSLLTGIS
jgi:hypothetical protein